jgi:predicted kinase
MSWDDGTISFTPKDLPTPASTEAVRQQVQRDIELYLERGGKVKHIDPGISAEDWDALAAKLRKSLASSAEQRKSAERRKKDKEEIPE